MSDRAYANAQIQEKTLSGPSPKSSLLQRTCACGQHTIAGGECEECRQKREGTLPRAAISSPPVGEVPPIVHEVLHSPGQLLDAATRAFIEPRFGHDFSQMPVHTSHSPVLQTKLTINKPGDIYEREADQVAEQVMTTPAHHSVSGTLPRIQRYSGQLTGQADVAPASVDHALASPGRPLEPVLRQDMEQRFGYDFSRVRVHSSAVAEQSARDVNAQAYTVGHDIVFDAGRYAPGTHEGRRLLAHELTHVVQQHHGQIHLKPRDVKISKPTASTDKEAAKRRARELAKLINTGKWTQENNEQLANWLQFFEGDANRAFKSELKEAIGKEIIEFKSQPEKHKPETTGFIEPIRVDYPGLKAKPRKLIMEYYESANVNLIVPTSKADVVQGGFKVGYDAQVSEETSDSTSVEVYQDLSGGGGVSLEMPIKKVLKIKIGVDVKRGRKTAEKHEEKKARRSGRTISRSFIIQKMERKVLNYQYIKRSYGPGPFPLKVTREETGRGAEIQQGYQIVPGEGGKPWGPYWNVYSGEGQVEGSALSQVWEVLTEEQEKIAEDLVFDRR